MAVAAAPALFLRSGALPDPLRNHGDPRGTFRGVGRLASSSGTVKLLSLKSGKFFSVARIPSWSYHTRLDGEPLEEPELFSMNQPHRTHPTFMSLFCGCGGFDLGFLEEQYRCVGAFDIDPVAVAVHRRNLRCSTELCDLSRYVPGLDSIGETDVVLAGPPCQGFSTTGRRDPDDPRNALVITAGRIALRVRPQVVVIENVAGIVAGAQRRYWERLKRMLRGAGYRAVDMCCDAAIMGVPQHRRRMVLLAWNSGKSARPHFAVQVGGNLRDAIRNIDGALDHSPRHLDVDSKSAKIAKRIAPGQKLCNVRSGPRAVHTWEIPEVFGRTTRWERTVLEALLRRRRQRRLRDFGDADPVSAVALQRFLRRPVAATLRKLVQKGFVRKLGTSYDLVHTFNGKFRRLTWDRPSPTVDTRFGDPWYFLHPDENRGFTVREAARLQTFPDWFVLDGTERGQYRLLGNAVPPALARCIASFVRKALLD